MTAELFTYVKLIGRPHKYQVYYGDTFLGNIVSGNYRIPVERGLPKVRPCFYIESSRNAAPHKTRRDAAIVMLRRHNDMQNMYKSNKNKIQDNRRR